MASSIDLHLVLEGEDAEEFWKDFHNPQVSEKQRKMFKEAIEIYKANPV